MIIPLLVLPTEIWLMIIKHAYPIRYGWNRDLAKLARTSKMHNSLVAYLLEKYIYLPWIDQTCDNNYLSSKNIIRYITRDIPIIEPGFLQDSLVTVWDSHPIINFSLKNHRTNELFFDKKYSNHRCLIANTYSSQKNNLADTELNEPFFIVPFDNKTGVFLIGKAQDYYYIVCVNSEEHSNPFISFYEKWICFLGNDTKQLEIIQYVLDTKNSIPDNIETLKNRAFGYFLKRWLITDRVPLEIQKNLLAKYND